VRLFTVFAFVLFGATPQAPAEATAISAARNAVVQDIEMDFAVRDIRRVGARSGRCTGSTEMVDERLR
jgi:hypothetical protein